MQTNPNTAPNAGRPAKPKASKLEGPKPSPIPIHNGVVSLSGYGVRVAVDRGQLVLADGTGSIHRVGRLSRPTSGLKRLTIRGQGGYITFDALHWLHGVGAGLVQIGYDGQIVAAIGPQGLNDPRLRRAQALAPWNDTGAALTRELLLDKLRGQASVLARLPNSGHATSNVQAAIEELPESMDLAEMRTVEGKAALAYWRAWEHVPVSWVRRDANRVPEHWREFGARMSPLSSKPRYAINPPNAILYYLYSVLEAETTIAARAVGLDPGIGLLHVDAHGRDSLALDLMEAVRHQVDAYLLDLLSGQPFAAAQFFETEKGVCRVMPPLSHTLAETGPLWQQAIAPIVERVARALHHASRDAAAAAPRSRIVRQPDRAWREPPTRLTQANKLASAATPRAPAAPPRACLDCGVVFAGDGRLRRRYCADCARLRNSQQARATRARMNARTPAEKWGLDADAAPDPRRFQAEVLPKLQNIVLRDIAAATGLSITRAGQIRNGRVVPHPSHWAELAALADTSTGANPMRRGSGRRAVTASQESERCD